MRQLIYEWNGAPSSAHRCAASSSALSSFVGPLRAVKKKMKLIGELLLALIYESDWLWLGTSPLRSWTSLNCKWKARLPFSRSEQSAIPSAAIPKRLSQSKSNQPNKEKKQAQCSFIFFVGRVGLVCCGSPREQSSPRLICESILAAVLAESWFGCLSRAPYPALNQSLNLWFNGGWWWVMACAKATHKSTSFASLKKKQTTLLFSLPQPAFQLAEKTKGRLVWWGCSACFIKHQQSFFCFWGWLEGKERKDKREEVNQSTINSISCELIKLIWFVCSLLAEQLDSLSSSNQTHSLIEFVGMKKRINQ